VSEATDAPRPAPAYLYLDTEATGVHDTSQIWQLAWLLEADGATLAERSVLVEHTDAPNPWVLQHTRYVAAMTSADPVLPLADAMGLLRADIAAYGLDDRKLFFVGAVPSFDDFRCRRVGNPPWHYHLIDIESVVMGRFGLASPPSLREIAELTGVVNLDPHDALADSKHVRDIHRWLLTHPVEPPAPPAPVDPAAASPAG